MNLASSLATGLLTTVLLMSPANAQPTKNVNKVTGRCHCGYITYAAEGPVIKCSYCDCGGCRKATGTLKAPFVTVRRTSFKVTSGQASEFRAKSKEKCDCHGVWYFCPKCGTQVFWKADEGDELDIFAGTLDDTTVFQPGNS